MGITVTTKNTVRTSLEMEKEFHTKLMKALKKQGKTLIGLMIKAGNELIQEEMLKERIRKERGE